MKLVLKKKVNFILLYSLHVQVCFNFVLKTGQFGSRRLGASIVCLILKNDLLLESIFE